MDSLLFSLNSVGPVFLVIGLGFFIKSVGMVDEQFVDTVNKLNFKVGIPTLLFSNIYAANIRETFNPKLLTFVLCSLTGVVLALWVAVPLFVKDKGKASAVIHTVFRNNTILLGIPLAANMFGERGVALISFVMPVTIPIYNFLGVVLLISFGEAGDENYGQKIKSTVAQIVRNNLILASIAAVLIQLLSFRLPYFVESAVTSVASMSTPLALITLGAQLDMRKVSSNLKYSLAATFLKLVAVPAVVLSVAVAAGFQGVELGVIFILFASPTAVTCYIMAREMNSNYELTGDVVLLSTFFSMFTMFIGIYLMKSLSLI